MTCLNYSLMIIYDVRGRFELAGIGNCFDRKYRPGWAILHEFARDSRHRADDDFLPSNKAYMLIYGPFICKVSNVPPCVARHPVWRDK